MTQAYPTPTRRELIDRMNEGLTQFLQSLATLSDGQLMNPTDEVGWNGRDHLTHLAAWAEGIAALLRREDRWAAMGLTVDNPEDDKPDFDGMNADIVVQHRHLTPAEAREWLVLAHERVVAAITRLEEGELLLAYEQFVPPFTGDQGRPIWNYVAGNTFGHYEEHQPWIEAIAAAASGK